MTAAPGFHASVSEAVCCDEHGHTNLSRPRFSPKESRRTVSVKSTLGTTAAEQKEDTMDPTHDRVKSSGEMLVDASQPIPFAGSVLDAQRHVCAFFHTADEEYRVLLPFIKDGFDRGEKAFHIVDPKLREEHRQRLMSTGIHVEKAEMNGQFGLCNWADAYLRDGHFDQDRMLTL